MTGRIIGLTDRRIAGLRYLLISGGQVSPEMEVFHNKAYRLWKNNWRQTFEELKSEAVPQANDFLRQNIIGALFDRDVPVGLLVHTYLNLDLVATLDHSYLSTYPAEVIEKLRSEGAKKVLTMEYLTLHEKWRKRLIGVSLAEVLLGLGAKIHEAAGFDAMLVVTRNDKHVNDILYGYGARCLASGLTKHNVAVDIVSLDSGSTHPGKSEVVNGWIEYFWKRRDDTVNISSLFERIIKKAA